MRIEEEKLRELIVEYGITMHYERDPDLDLADQKAAEDAIVAYVLGPCATAPETECPKCGGWFASTEEGIVPCPECGQGLLVEHVVVPARKADLVAAVGLVRLTLKNGVEGGELIPACPECNADARTPKCPFDLGGGCPRHESRSLFEAIFPVKP